MTACMPEVPRAKKSLGQNFLQDKNIARLIVEALQLESHDRVIEIGPGPGALTQYIRQAKPDRLWLLEKDHYWAVKHGSAATEEVVLTDALTFAWHKLGKDFSWKIIGNLPYNMASLLMWDILSQARFTRAVFMMQKEVGERILATPGTRQYGALSVWLQSHVTACKVLPVPPSVFKPRPKVDSLVLAFTPLPVPSIFFNSGALVCLLRVCFQQRRKQLQKILRSFFDERLMEWFEHQSIKPSARPEELTPKQFQALANLLESRLAP